MRVLTPCTRVIISPSHGTQVSCEDQGQESFCLFPYMDSPRATHRLMRSGSGPYLPIRGFPRQCVGLFIKPATCPLSHMGRADRGALPGQSPCPALILASDRLYEQAPMCSQMAARSPSEIGRIKDYGHPLCLFHFSRAFLLISSISRGLTLPASIEGAAASILALSHAIASGSDRSDIRSAVIASLMTSFSEVYCPEATASFTKASKSGSNVKTITKATPSCRCQESDHHHSLPPPRLLITGAHSQWVKNDPYLTTRLESPKVVPTSRPACANHWRHGRSTTPRDRF